MKQCIGLFGILLLSAILATGASAQKSLSFHGGLDLDRSSGFIGGAIQFGIGLGDLGLSLRPGFDYYLGEETYPCGWTECTATTFQGNLDVLYVLQQSGKVDPFFGAGVGIVMLNETIEASGISGSEFQTGLNLVGGASYKVTGRLRPFAQVRLYMANSNSMSLIGGVMIAFGDE